MKCFVITSAQVIICLVTLLGSLAGIGSFVIDCYDKPGLYFCKFFTEKEPEQDTEETKAQVFKRPEPSENFRTPTATHSNAGIFLRTQAKQ